MCRSMHAVRGAGLVSFWGAGVSATVCGCVCCGSVRKIGRQGAGTEARGSARAARQAFASRVEQPEHVGFCKSPGSGQEVSADESQARSRLEGVRGESECRGGRIRSAENM
eukprot:837451-Pleurochrysis_carterae.AAC.1